MRTKDYIEAAHGLLKGGTDEAVVFTKLKGYLEKRGLAKLYPSVLRGLAEKIRRTDLRARTKVVVAREGDAKLHAGEIEKAVAEVGKGTGHDVVVDETIIGGFVVKGRDERLDRSYKSTLLHAYHRLTD